MPSLRPYIGSIPFLIASITLYWRRLGMRIISFLVIHVRNCLRLIFIIARANNSLLGLTVWLW
jgi:hypothetical protein